MLAAVAYSAERLLLSSDWRDAIDDVLMHLGVAAGVSRAYLIEVGTLETGFRATQLAEWCAPGVTSQFENPTLRGTPLAEAGFGRWIELMSSRATVHGVISEFPEEERLELAKQDIRSIAAFPVFVDGDWWAFIGFDDCLDDREWTAFELDSLRAAAGVLGAAEQADRADARRRHAEVRYQRLVEQNPAVTYTESHDPEGGRLTFISPQLQDLLGYAPEVPLGDRDWWWGHVHPDDRDAVQVANRTAFSRGTAFDQTYRMRTADGTWAWVRDEVRPILGDAGQILYWQGFLVGVTERVETEERLREAEARFRAMVERIPAVTYTDHVGADGVTVMGFVSPQIESILGYRPERFLERADLWFEVMHPDDLARLREIDAFNNSDLEPFEHEYRMHHADGRWVWVHDTSTAVLNEDGELDYFLGLPDRCELSPRRRGAPPRGGAHVPHDGRAEPGGLLHPVHRSRRSHEVAHAVRRTRRREADGRPRRSDDRRSRSVAVDGPPGRPADGLRGRRIEQYGRLGPVRPRVPHGPHGRRHRLGPRRGDAGPSRERAAVLAGVPAGHHGAQGGGASPARRPRASAADGRPRSRRRREHGRGGRDHRLEPTGGGRRSAGAPRR